MQGKSVAASQMLAAIGQSRLMHAYQELFSRRGIVVAQTLLIARDVDDRVGYLNVRNTLNGLLERGVVPIVNENDVVDTKEINGQRFGDNDTLSAIVANVIDADLLLMLTDTGGLFTADPNRDPAAELIPRVDRDRRRHHVPGRGAHERRDPRGDGFQAPGCAACHGHRRGGGVRSRWRPVGRAGGGVRRS